MPQFSIAPGQAAIPVLLPQIGGLVTNRGPATVYYGKTSATTDAVNDGSLASGSAASLYGSTYFYTPVPASGLGGRNQIEYVTSTSPRISVLTAAQYAALTQPSPDILYVLVG